MCLPIKYVTVIHVTYNSYFKTNTLFQNLAFDSLKYFFNFKNMFIEELLLYENCTYLMHKI